MKQRKASKRTQRQELEQAARLTASSYITLPIHQITNSVNTAPTPTAQAAMPDEVAYNLAGQLPEEQSDMPSSHTMKL